MDTENKDYSSSLSSQDGIKRVLVVDDNVGQCARLRSALEKVSHQYQLDWCPTVAGALKKLYEAEQPYQAVLLDYHIVPSGSGNELLTETYTHNHHLPVIVMSKQHEEALDLTAIKAGASDYLSLDVVDGMQLERSIRYAIDRKYAEAQLTKLAHFDPLTGIPNRSLFRDRLDSALRRAERENQSVVLMFIDLDHFKQVNDTLGHHVGDKVLQQVAKRLKRCIRKSDSLARIGGDEFTLILENTHNITDVVNVAEKIIESLTKPFSIEKNVLVLGCSIGIARSPDNGRSLDALLNNADQAMYTAKQQKGNTYRFYTDALNDKVSQQQDLEEELRLALTNNQLEVYYQPRVDTLTGSIVAVEALMRWRHPTRGLLTPNHFITLAESTGLIVPMGYWLIERACSDVQHLVSKGHPPIQLAVNISPRQFHDPKLTKTIANILARHRFDAHLLELDLPEVAMIEATPQSSQNISGLHNLGVKFFLDDFGTGHSSVVLIQQMPITGLKVDRSFVMNALKSEDDAQLVQAIISLAHNLKMQVIAAGAETKAHVDRLQAQDCDQVQGYYFSPPIPIDTMVLLLGNKRKSAATAKSI